MSGWLQATIVVAGAFVVHFIGYLQGFDAGEKAAKK